MGGIAIKKMSEQEQPDLYINYQIIDGQQRIITVFALLLAILNSRFLDESRDAETIFYIREIFFLEKKREEEERGKIRLLTNSQIEDFEEEAKEEVFDKIIQKSPDLETLKGNKIWEAYNFFATEIKKEEVARNLDLIVDKVKESLMFILIETDTLEDGRKVFENINHPNLILTQADEVKLFLSYRRNRENFSKQKWIKIWKTLVKNVGEENLNHFFFIYLNKHERKRGVYSGSEFVNYFKKWANKNKPSFKALLDEILKDSIIYQKILNPSHDFWDEDFFQRIIELNILGSKVKGLYSFVILLREYIEKDNTKVKLVNNILEKVILLIFRRRFWGERGLHWEEVDRWNEKVRKNQLDTILQDPVVIREINNVGFWNTLKKENNSSKENNKYLLARFYFTLMPKDTSPNLKNLQIEHIFPESPVPEWLEIPQWKEIKKEKIKKNYLNCLGNLTLLSSQQNISAKNYTWEVKKTEVQEKTFLKLENNELDLFNKKEFLPSHINIRKEWLITQLLEKNKLFIDVEVEKKLLKELVNKNTKNDF
ncbi:MAG: hypothetical protein MRERC_4c075 [Mycoplasmataceae bacterium RC_NB112A]|nr:MAG: hypothetical protein MRERC_4c075 [Mycoplasmataceae bacterium RC_NB112A]